MDNSKICFIACIDDDEYEKECLLYLGRLNVPEGYVIDYIGIREAKSISGGYNEAIEASDAKYKVYLKQGVYITETDFIYRLLEIFEDSKVGLVGVRGAAELSNDMIISHSLGYQKSGIENTNGKKYINAQAVDGTLIATQYDIPFNEKLFVGSDFFDVSISAEFIKAGYKVAIASQGEKRWVHDTNDICEQSFSEKDREIALNEYQDVFNLKPNKKRLAFIYFKEITITDVLWALLQTDYDIDIIDLETSIYSKDKDDAEAYCIEIKRKHLDAVLSFDFCPALSDACEKCNIKYIAWSYDAPLQALYEDQVRNKCNYIFSFDKYQVEETKRYGAEHVYHLPLGSNITRNTALIVSKEDERKYSCDVSFIGNLYTDNIYELVSEKADESVKREYDAIIEDIYGKWDGTNKLTKRLSKETIDSLVGVMSTIDPNSFGPDYKMDLDEFFCARLISRYVTYKERIEILKRLSKYKLKFFTKEKNTVIDGVKCLPPLSYEEELPKAYNLSKINLNITLHSIISGIPLRVFDIMGVGGFMLTNYQPEIDECFKIGKEIEVYHDFDELEDKVRYYLSHDKIRKEIALNGYYAIKNRYGYEKQVNKILEVMKEHGLSN